MLFTVFGVFEDTRQRYASVFEADDVDSAEEMAYESVEEAGDTLLIAAVVEGDITTVDTNSQADQSAF